jgi:formyltetrahydrofolate-dependent phosphoribosylglycinamide formyltransferase
MTGKRLAVLASGGGSNLQALLEHLDALGERRPGDVVLVASDAGAAGALARASAHGVAHRVLEAAARGAGMLAVLREHAIDIVVLAGYLRFVPNDVTRAYRGAIVNVHPALLPAFGGSGMYGARVHAAVIAGGARVSGATVHFVDEQYDHGPIIAQWPVPVFPDDTPATLGPRVLRVEHVLYPRVVEALAAGRIRLGEHGRVTGWPPARAGEHFTPASDVRLPADPDPTLSPSP